MFTPFILGFLSNIICIFQQNEPGEAQAVTSASANWRQSMSFDRSVYMYFFFKLMSNTEMLNEIVFNRGYSDF